MGSESFGDDLLNTTVSFPARLTSLNCCPSFAHYGSFSYSQPEGALCIYPPYLLRGTTPFYSTKEFKVVYGGQLGFRKPDTLI